VRKELPFEASAYARKVLKLALDSSVSINLVKAAKDDGAVLAFIQRDHADHRFAFFAAEAGVVRPAPLICIV
jgi:hypothetical protein